MAKLIINGGIQANNLTLNNPLPITSGGTGASDGNTALTNLGAKDYIVEQGTSGIWTYRKWNSGYAELDGTLPSASYNTSAVSGALYYTSTDKFSSFPFTFTKLLSLSSAMMPTSSNCGAWAGSITTKGIGILYIQRGSNSTVTGSICVRVTGKWK